MRRIVNLFGVVVFTLILVAVPAYAAVRSNDTVIVGKDEVINDDFFAAGDTITIEGTINGDVYVAGSRVNIRGTVNGDVLAGANTIEVTGTITEDLRAGASTVSLVGATIGDSVSVAGNELSIDEASEIGGGLVFGGRSLQLDGSVGRGVTSGSEFVRLDGEVGRTSRIAATNLTIAEDAVINGDLEYNSENEATINGEVTGKIIRSNQQLDLQTETIARWFVVGFSIWAFLAAVLISGVMVVLMPKLLTRSNDQLLLRPGKVIGRGTIILFVTVPLAIALMFSVIGVPLGFILLVLWFLSIYFAKFFAGFALGHYVIDTLASKSDRSPRIFTALVLGLALYYLLRVLPYVGVFVRLATTIIGIGMMASLYSRSKARAEN